MLGCGWSGLGWEGAEGVGVLEAVRGGRVGVGGWETPAELGFNSARDFEKNSWFSLDALTESLILGIRAGWNSAKL